MKITAVSTAQVPSTTANSIQVMKTCQALVQNGHELRLLLPAASDQAAKPGWQELARHYGLSATFAVEWLPTRPFWQRNDFAWQAARQARGSDWIYTWSFQAAVFALYLGKAALLEVHDLPSGRLGPWWLETFLRRKGTKRLVLITNALQQALTQRYGALVEACRPVIAPNGVEPERYEGLPGPFKARRALRLSDGLTVECSGHLYAGRGGELFLALANRFPQVNFLWVGGRPEDVEAHAQKAAQRGLRNTAFIGHVPQADVPLYQAAADVLLMPYERMIAGSGGGNSAAICSPMKLFDYLAAGRAILSSDLPVIREILDEDCARFAPPDDEMGWAAALGELLSKPDLRERLAGQARERAARYSWRGRAEKCLPVS